MSTPASGAPGAVSGGPAVGAVSGAPAARVRDPSRKDRILFAAADLVARRGYHAASMTDIGAAAGVTGSAIYRHFTGKPALLVALFDRAMDGLLEDERRLLAAAPEPRQALACLVEGQISFVIDDRELAQVYYREVNNLPEEDRRRLRRKQRQYLEPWTDLVDGLRPDVTQAEARVLVHAAIGAIQSPLFHSLPPSVSGECLRHLLRAAAWAVLGVRPPPAGSGGG